jgi:hypothetical protein
MSTSSNDWLMSTLRKNSEPAAPEPAQHPGVSPELSSRAQTPDDGPVGESSSAVSAPAASGASAPVWLTVWWPGTAVDMDAAVDADIPSSLGSGVFGSIPAALRPAVAFAVLRKAVTGLASPGSCRTPIGFDLNHTDTWTIAVPVTITQPADMVALFTIDRVAGNHAPVRYVFSAWVSPADGANLVGEFHDTVPSWLPLPDPAL